MALPSELRSALPASLSPESARAAVRVPGSRNSFAGETWIVDLDGRLAVLERRSIFDPLRPVELADEDPLTPHGEGVSTTLALRCADGERFELRATTREAEEVARLLSGVEGVAPPAGEPEPLPEPLPEQPDEPRAPEAPEAPTAQAAAPAGREEARRREVELLRQRAAGLGGMSEEYVQALEELIAEFPDAAWPRRDLADHIEFDQPLRAIDLLRQALAREYEPRALEALADLYEGLHRYGEAMRLTEDALARDQKGFDHAALRERLGSLRRRFGLRETGAVKLRSTAELEAERKQGRFVALAVLLGLILFAVLAGILDT